jgi:hypothetical protein
LQKESVVAVRLLILRKRSHARGVATHIAYAAAAESTCRAVDAAVSLV